MANFKGTVFESTRLFALREYGEEGLERVLSELTPEDRSLLAGITAVGWYPVEPVLRFHHALDQVFGNGDYSVCVAAGRFSAGWSFNTVLKLFVRFRSPLWLIERATSVWGRYHDTGKWQMTSPTPGRMVGEIRDFAVRDPAFCARLRGWLQGAIELTGGQGATVAETRCACLGHEHCTFALSWQG